MIHNYWNEGYFGWIWVFWIALIFLMFSSFGNWRYTYHAHRRYDLQPKKQAFDILDERYARGDITREQYAQMKSDILTPTK
jgi:putative membrane protein